MKADPDRTRMHQVAAALSSRGALLAVFAIVACLSYVVLVVLNREGQSSEGVSTVSESNGVAAAPVEGLGGGIFRASPDGDPFRNGKEVSLPQAQAEAPFHVYVPNDPLTPTSESVTWIESNQGDAGPYTQVDTQYSSGVNILTTTDTKIDYERLAESFPGIANVTTLRGVPAMIIRQDTDMTGQNPGSVALTLGASHIVVMGHYPITDLERIVDSLS